jgi:dolichol-phosphate mannosyltransferase
MRPAGEESRALLGASGTPPSISSNSTSLRSRAGPARAERTFAAGRATRFALVGLSGIAVNQLALFVGTEWAGIQYLIAAILATQVSTTWNFLGADRWAFGGRDKQHSGWYRYGAYLGLNNVTLIARVPALWLLTDLVGIHYLWANLVTLVALFAVRYVTGETWIWRPKASVDPTDRPMPTSTAPSTPSTETSSLTTTIARPAKTNGGVGPAVSRYRYDVAGLLDVQSAVELPELRMFQAKPNGHAPDIRISVRRVGLLPSFHTRFAENGDELAYLEHLGAAGANFRLSIGEPIEVQASPLLALSRHVLYTNVIEALLRFVLVSKGHVLLHSACVEVDGHAALLSAQTDTGKTSTVIKLVRERGYHFLSDDMTIVAPSGNAIHYPKPMTLSSHTMAAVRSEELKPLERIRLAVQSRLHSKSGRSIGKTLGRLNLPIMSINSLVQAVIPPPKYHIGRLIPCQMCDRAPIRHVFLMERGEPGRERLDVDDAVPRLIENTDDAYGFPPFSTFAPHLRIGNDDYASLRAREADLLAEALTGAAVWRLSVPDHGWAELLPRFIEERVQTVTAQEASAASSAAPNDGALAPAVH